MTVTTDLANKIKDLLNLVGKGSIENLQTETSKLPKGKITDESLVPLFENGNDISASIKDLEDHFKQSAGPVGSIGMNSLDNELKRYIQGKYNSILLNPDFYVDTNGDGLADFWDLEYTNSVRNPTTGISGVKTPIYLDRAQHISIDGIGSDPAEYISLSQTFPRGLIQNQLKITGYCWTSQGNIILTLYYKTSPNADLIIITSKSISHDILANNPHFELEAIGIANNAQWLVLEVSIIGGTGENTPHSFTIGGIDASTTLDNKTGINVLSNGQIYRSVNTLNIDGATITRTSPDHLDVDIIPYSIEGNDQKTLKTRSNVLVMPTTSVSYFDEDDAKSNLVVVPQISVIDKTGSAVQQAQFKLGDHL